MSWVVECTSMGWFPPDLGLDVFVLFWFRKEIRGLCWFNSIGRVFGYFACCCYIACGFMGLGCCYGWLYWL